jgi:hypothetical protein
MNTRRIFIESAKILFAANKGLLREDNNMPQQPPVQQQTTGGQDPFAADPNAQPQTDPNNQSPQGTNTPTITIDTIIDSLNLIRGGKSFAEPDVYKVLSDFFNTVPQTEREVVDKFLTGLAKTVETNAPGAQPPQQTSPTNQQQSMPPANPPTQQAQNGGGMAQQSPAATPIQ